MELITEQMQTVQFGKQMEDRFVMDEDYNVPDSKEDARRILASDGKVSVDQLALVENYLHVSGKLEFQVLYMTDSAEQDIASLEGSIPFEEMICVEAEPNVEYVMKDTHVELDVRLIHSRKINLKSAIVLTVIPECVKEEALVVDVESGFPIYKKKKEFALLRVHTTKTDTYRIREELILPGTKETIGTILWTDVTNCKFDTKLEEDTLLISGELQLFCFYESLDGRTDWIEEMVPYEGKIECPGADVLMYHHLHAKLVDVIVDARMDEDGEMRVIGLEGTLELHLAVYEETAVEMLQDLYATDYDCEMVTEQKEYEELLLQNYSKCKVTEQLVLPELPSDILQICHSNGSVQVERTELVANGLQMEGVLHVWFLYVRSNDEMPFGTWRGMIPFSHVVACESAKADVCYDIAGNLEQLSIALMGEDRVEIKAALAFRSFLRNRVKLDVLTDVLAEKMDERELEKQPGIVCCIVGAEDDLWSIAKRYHTTIESILEVNACTEEKIKTGERILIFRENVSIL